MQSLCDYKVFRNLYRRCKTPIGTDPQPEAGTLMIDHFSNDSTRNAAKTAVKEEVSTGRTEGCSLGMDKGGH